MAFQAGGMHNTDLYLYRDLISRKMQLVTWQTSHWYNLMGFVGGQKNFFDRSPQYANTELAPTATGKPIEVYQDFRVGGERIKVPTFYPLTNPAIKGSTPAEGKGEKARLAVMEVPINQVRQVFLKQDTKMSRQIWENIPIRQQLYDRAGDYLGDWFRRWLAFQPYWALLQGSSENLVGDGGVGLQKQSHMNLYVQGSGKVAFSNVHATYEADVAAALNGLGTGDVFNTDFLQNLIYEASHSHQIMPVTIGGHQAYPVLVSDAHMLQLKQDSKYVNIMQYGAERDSKLNPLFTNRIAGLYGGALLITDATIPSAYTSSDAGVYTNAASTTGDANGVCYGTVGTDGKPDYMATPVDSGTKKPVFLLGQSAVLAGVGSDIEIEEETKDFNQKIEIEADMRIGMTVADIYDKDGTFGTSGNYRYENRSSLVGFTYTPAGGSWS